MDPYLEILLKVSLSFGALIALFLLTIVYMRSAYVRDEKRYDRAADLWENNYLSYITGALSLNDTARLLGPVKKFKHLRRFFSPYLETLSGDDFEKTKALCRELGLIDYYQRALTKGSTSKKAIAAHTLGSLKCKRSLPERIALLKSGRPLLVRAAAEGLAASGEAEGFEPAARALLGSTQFTYEGATAILAGYGAAACGMITEQLAARAEALKKEAGPYHGPASRPEPPDAAYTQVLIDLIGHFRHQPSLKVLGRLLKAADEETAVHLLKAFLRIGALPKGLDLKELLDHKSWVMRSFAVRAFTLSGSLEELETVAGLTSDENWWVRYHAALSLLKAGEPGRAILEKLAAGPKGLAAWVSRYQLDREGAY